MSATEKYLTRKQKMMTLQSKIIELQPNLNKKKKQGNESDETTEEEDKFEFEAHCAVIDDQAKQHQNEPFVFKRGEVLNIQETQTSVQ